ncbi:DUF7856 family protein [Halorubrum ezzemoulense]|uniref:DUF7856 family protein n=1 Tax=Halorubrum ezzemoulense TaxID=337243 RepID=UPI0023310243|nr:hypothetical protein [Halorubrum ezzemoulense]MDB2238433.1 hypothetical protein [Halorubrum ezzemoulense]MDB2247903.1 hypothetical protein [Halorubrum ezzemoulense]MDB2260599.1 hypothetical protein [Halorubrum ezzemoulense]MDB2264978.1 hypothetical protein [Halorubrum ezzemoulense]MDB2267008.1 hypothetical protein [Halorubrum ezzemoulense]
MTGARSTQSGSNREDSEDGSDAVRGSPAPGEVPGRLPADAGLRRQLAAAARSRGRTASVAGEIADIEAELAGIEVEPVDLTAARRRVAEATGEIERLKERVAALRGDARARRAVDAETDETLDDLEAAAAELSAAQTEAIAAEQALERARAEAARARDERRRRLRLRDRLRNRRGVARRELAEAMYPEFRRALAVVPSGDPSAAGTGPGAYDGDPVAASLAAVRTAALDGPVELRGSAARRIEESGRSPRSLLRTADVRFRGARDGR